MVVLAEATLEVLQLLLWAGPEREVRSGGENKLSTLTAAFPEVAVSK